ncbi:MAG: hypothetical protein PHI63_04605, partial [Patescibacteria group bacterium]|nr:hypothetical protein [Patescibacteria group bacterium]
MSNESTPHADNLPVIEPPQGFDEPPAPKSRAALILFILITVAAALIVGGVYVVSQTLLKLPAKPWAWIYVPPGGTGQPTGTALVPTDIKKFASYEELTEFLANHSQ